MGQYFSQSSEQDFSTKFVNDKLLHGYNLFTRNSNARFAFTKFIKHGFWIEHITIPGFFSEFCGELNFQDLDDLETGSNQSKITEDLIRKLKKISNDNISNFEAYTGTLFNSYFLPFGSCVFIESSFFKDSPTYTKYFTQIFLNKETKEPEFVTNKRTFNNLESCFSKQQMKSIVIGCLFPLFLESIEFEEFIENEKFILKYKNSIASLDTPCTINNESKYNSFINNNNLYNQTLCVNDYIENQKSNENNYYNNETYNNNSEYFNSGNTIQELRINDIIAEAAASIDITEIERLLFSGQWLSNLLSSVEDLEICVTLSSARKDRMGFPLVYVNKEFEKLTLYDRKHVIGHKCSHFMQCKNTEKQQIKLISEALRTAQPIKVALTNIRSDGTEFFNLLALKPIFDMNGEYAYVIGVQYDLTGEDSSMKQLKLIDDVLALLPNILK
jgi:PAS domain S-box-containing protein